MAQWLRTPENHVVPLNDFRGHDRTISCWCHPTDEDGVIVHHSMDRREEYEMGRLPS